MKFFLFTFGSFVLCYGYELCGNLLIKNFLSVK